MQLKLATLTAVTVLAGFAAAQCSDRPIRQAQSSLATEGPTYTSYCQSLSAGSTTVTSSLASTLTVTSGVSPTPATTSPAATPNFLAGKGPAKRTSICSCLALGTTTFTVTANQYLATTTLGTTLTTTTTTSSSSTTTTTSSTSTTSTTSSTSTTSTTSSTTSTSTSPTPTPTCAGTSGPNGGTVVGAAGTYTVYCAQQVGGYATLYFAAADPNVGVNSCVSACDQYNSNPSQPGRSCVGALYHIPQQNCELLYYVAPNSLSPRSDTDLIIKN